MRIGANCSGKQRCEFVVWAPFVKKIGLKIVSPQENIIPMEKILRDTGRQSLKMYLKDLGINAVEIMPVAQFPGERNRGYDRVVYPFAVQNSYGGPDGLKRLVNDCHQDILTFSSSFN